MNKTLVNVFEQPGQQELKEYNVKNYTLTPSLLRVLREDKDTHRLTSRFPMPSETAYTFSISGMEESTAGHRKEY